MRRFFIFTGLVFVLFLSCSRSLVRKGAEIQNQKAWIWGGSPARNGYCPDGPVPPFRNKWVYKANGALDKAICAQDHYLYFGTKDGSAYVLDSNTGEVVRRKNILRKKDVSCIVDDQKLYASLRWGKHSIEAYDLFSGKKVWKVRLGPVHGEPLIIHNQLLTVTEKGRILSLNKESGDKLWDKRVDYPIITSLTYDHSFLYFGSSNSTIWCISFEDRTVKWKTQVEGGINATPVFHNNKLFLGTIEGKFYCLSAENGSVLWHFSSNGGIYESAAAGPGIIVFGTTRGFLYCLNEDGSQRWIFNTGSVIGASPLICNGIVYFGTLSRQLIGVDADRGDERWRFQTRGRIRTSPLIWNNMLFAASEDRYVYGFSAAY